VGDVQIVHPAEQPLQPPLPSGLDPEPVSQQIVPEISNPPAVLQV
jgi:hypothetical protein